MSLNDSMSDHELVERALRGIKLKKGEYFWAKVMKTFQLGSTYAQQLCRDHDYNPDNGFKIITPTKETMFDRLRIYDINN